MRFKDFVTTFTLGAALAGHAAMAQEASNNPAPLDDAFAGSTAIADLADPYERSQVTGPIPQGPELRLTGIL